LQPTSLYANHKRTTQPRRKRTHLRSSPGLSVEREASKVRELFRFPLDILSRKRVGASRTAFRELRNNIYQSSSTSLPVVWTRRAWTTARKEARSGFAILSAIYGEGKLLSSSSDSISYDDITRALRRRPNSRRNPCFNDAIHHLTSNNSRQRAQAK
jgi:hypothetical protein